VFHHTLPEKAARFPLPERFWAAGIRRYGFHGLSCESVIAALGDSFPDRAVIAHLGNGASVTAVHKEKSVETTMGLTPTGGVTMATRSGDLDPGLLLYLLRTGNYKQEDLDKLLNHESGMHGVSGLSGDMRTLIDASQRDRKAALAIEMFCYSVQKSIGAMAAVLNGIELLVFTGGIGENVSIVRSNICRGLGYLGIALDPELNAQNASIITVPESACMVRVVPSQEDVQIARHAHRLFRVNAN
jgi:acetate kinase